MVNKDKLVSNVLSLSYTHLPNHLKPFFLYMGGFRENREILSSKLIRQCVAEGFIRPVLGRSLEEAARMYLKALVDRNLLLVHRHEINGKVRSFMIHDLLRGLSIKKTQEEKFLQTLPSEDLKNFRRLSAHSYYQLKQMRTNLLLPARSFIYTGGSRHDMRSKLKWFDISRSQLLRVFDAFHLTTLCYASEQVQKVVNVRYLGTPVFLHLPCSVSNLCNFQTLILHTSSEEPIFSVCELLNLPCLRHIKFSGIYPLFDLPHCREVSDLQPLSSVKIDDSFPKVLKAVPNLEKLGIFVSESMPISCSIDLTVLAKLENLQCSSNSSDMPSPFLTFLIFPPSLKKLTLKECRIPLGYLEIISVLPNLEILKLQRCNLENSTWEPTNEGFRNLRLLLLERLNLVYWIAGESHYPRLEQLFIQDCSQLDEILSEIGVICTLEMIEVHGYNNSSALVSARKIQDEQLEMENNLLRVHISASSHSN